MNTGARPGVETAQLYVGERGTSIARPVRELKGYERVSLAPGESRRVRFVIKGEDLAFTGLDGKRKVEPGELSVWIAPNAEGGTPATLRIAP